MGQAVVNSWETLLQKVSKKSSKSRNCNDSPDDSPLETVRHFFQNVALSVSKAYDEYMFDSNTVKRAFEETSFKKQALEDIVRKIMKFTAVAEEFFKDYERWMRMRDSTLEKLRRLEKAVHSDQLNYNTANMVFLGANATTRGISVATNSIWASVATLVSGIASSVSSSLQAKNVDEHIETFRAIMKLDAQSTNIFYSSRGRCKDSYIDVEEMARMYAGDSFTETLNHLGKLLGKLVLEVQEAKLPMELLVIRFFAADSEGMVLGDILGSTLSYAYRNPAAVDAFINVAKTAGDAISLSNWNENSSIRGRAASNGVQLAHDVMSVHRLSEIVGNEKLKPQCPVESAIQKAIMDLENDQERMSGEVGSIQDRLSRRNA